MGLLLDHSTQVGKYKLGKTLGQGGYGKVKIATNVETGATVAVKIMDKEKIHERNFGHDINREIASMMVLSHTHVVQLLEVMASDSEIYLVLEHMPGGVLHQKLVAQTILEEKEARKYFQQLIDGIDYCHRKNICHRDIKPSNLLIDANGNLKIGDFGSSVLCPQFKYGGLLFRRCGTPGYTAPEVFNDDAGYNGAIADLWSCGVTLFVLMAGYLPFQEETKEALLCLLQGKYVCPYWISSGVGQLIRRILDPNPKTCATIAKIRNDPWFQEGYTPPTFEKDEGNEYMPMVGFKRDANRPMNVLSEMSSLSCSLDNSSFFAIPKKKLSSSFKKVIAIPSKKPPKETIVGLDSMLLSHWIQV